MDSYPRCGTCTHFIAPEDADDWGECSFIVDEYCLDINKPPSFQVAFYKAILPFIDCGDGDGCLHLRVHPTFGCVYHQAKES